MKMTRGHFAGLASSGTPFYLPIANIGLPEYYLLLIAEISTVRWQ
jgi:hypothetical protein